MRRVTVIVRELGRLKPDYSLEFDLPEVPRVGDYISVQRPNHKSPWGEDMIVRQVWWRLSHPETGGYGATPPKIGKVDEIYVECEPAIGPWSSDSWRDSMKHLPNAPKLEVARLSIREDGTDPE